MRDEGCRTTIERCTVSGDQDHRKAQPSINEPLVREPVRGEFIDKRENVLLIGNSGTGKTHLACALAFSACMQGHRVRFPTITGLVAERLECREDRILQRFQKQLERQQLLILDELGYVPFSKAGAELFFQVVSRAYERQSLMVTTNLPFENWTEVLGSERLTGALLDRLTHRVYIIEADGEPPADPYPHNQEPERRNILTITQTRAQSCKQCHTFRPAPSALFTRRHQNDFFCRT